MAALFKSQESLQDRIIRLKTLNDNISNLQQAIDVLQNDLDVERANCGHELIKDADGVQYCAICGADLTTEISLGKIKVLG